MKIDNSKIKGYLIHETACGYKLCKILNEYDKDQKDEAKDDLINLLTNNKTEKDILKEYSKKKIF